jgi:RNA polymerase sigma-70 factor (ECF subfamily)
MTVGVTQRAAQPSDVKALEREALGHSAALFRLAARLLGNTADAEDVVQEAFIKAISELRRGAFRGDSSLSTWLYRVVTHVALDRLRHVKRQASSEPATEPTSSASPDAAVALRELADAMKETFVTGDQPAVSLQDAETLAGDMADPYCGALLHVDALK